MEVAIVLAIFGVVLASIFALVGPVRARVRVDRASNELHEIVSNVKGYYLGRMFPSGLAACPTTFSSANRMPAASGWTAKQYADFGIFPRGMVRTIGASTHVGNALATSGSTTTVAVDLCGASPVTFAVRYSNVEKTDCINIILKTSSNLLETGLQYIKVNNGPALSLGVDGSVSISEVSAVAACGALSATGVPIDWYFRLGG